MFLQNQIERISLWGIASKCGWLEAVHPLH
jgi:hypothetical protein